MSEPVPDALRILARDLAYKKRVLVDRAIRDARQKVIDAGDTAHGAAQQFARK